MNPSSVGKQFLIVGILAVVANIILLLTGFEKWSLWPLLAVPFLRNGLLFADAKSPKMKVLLLSSPILLLVVFLGIFVFKLA